MAKGSAAKNIVFEGLVELIDQFRALPLEIGGKAKDAFNAFAEEVMEESKTLVPYDPNRATGAKKYRGSPHLKDTAFIRKAASLKNPTTWFGYGAPHAFLVENDIAGRSHVGGSGEKPTPGYSTSGTGAKYLARPFKARQGGLEKKIERILEDVCNNASS